MSSIDKDAFIRCNEAVHLVCSSAVPCIQGVIQTWHFQQQQKIGTCTNPPRCPTTGKPKPPRSCQACFSWGSALAKAEYTDPTNAINSSIAWTNINATKIFNDAVEVAKAYGIKLPKGQKPPTTFNEFDTASLLLMMMKFEEFHRRDHSSYLIIKKVSAIRNSLSHLRVVDMLHISNQKLQSNFQDITNLINCLQRLHPNHFKATLVSDIRSQLHDVFNAPITAKMRDEAMKPLTDAMIDVVCQTMEEQFKQFTPNISSSVAASVSNVNRDLKQEIVQEVKHEIQKELQYQAQTISTGFQQISDAYNVHQKSQAEATEGIHTMMETLHHTSEQGNQNVQQSIKIMGQQVLLDVQQSCVAHEDQASAIVAELHSKMDTMQRATEQGHQKTKQDIIGLKQELRQTSGAQSSYLQAQTSAIGSLHSKMDRNRLEIQQTICDAGVQAEQDVQLARFDVQRCREELKAEYRQVRGKVSLLPGMPEEFGNMDDLYVDLELVEDLNKHLTQNQSTQMSQFDMLDLKDPHGKPLNRILVRGGPGCGKTMLVSKLAYDWATGSATHSCAREKRELLFALDMREIRHKMDIIDVIQDQLLPKVDREGMMAYITSHPGSVAFLLDGYDEAVKTVKVGDINHLLSNKWLQESLVIVTTRPHKYTDFVKSFGTCTVVDVMKWSFKRISEFIVKYFDVMLFLGCIGNKVGEICEEPSPFYLWGFHPNFVANETIQNLHKELASISKNLSDCVYGAFESHREKAEEMLLLYRLASKEPNSDIHQEGLKELESFLKLFWSTYGPPEEIYILLIEIQDFLKILVNYGHKNRKQKTIHSGNSTGIRKQLLAVVELVRKTIHDANDIINTAEKIQCNVTHLKHSDMYTPNPKMTKTLEEISYFVDKLCDFRTHWSQLQFKLDNITSLLELYKCWIHLNNTSYSELHLEEVCHLFYKSFGQPDLLTKVASRLQIFLTESLNVFGNWAELFSTLWYFQVASGLSDKPDNLFRDFEGVALSFSTLLPAENMEKGVFDLYRDGLAASADIEEVWTKCYREAELLREFEKFNFLMLTKPLQSQLAKLKPHLELLSIVVVEREHEFQHLVDAEHFVEIFTLPCCSIPENVSVQVKKLNSFFRPFASNVSRENILSKVNAIVHLLEQIWSSQQVRKLTEIPCLLTMICMLWEEEMKLPATTTELYEQSMLFLAKHAEAKSVEAVDINDDEVKHKLDAIMLVVGKLGFQGLIENKLVFSNNELEDTILEESCRLGLITKERRRSKLQSKTFVSFAHKTFQEYCAACYLAYLASGDTCVFEANIEKILPDGATSYDDNFLMLQFLCGLSSEATGHILSQYVQMTVSKQAISREINKTLILFSESRTPNTIKYLEPLLNKQSAVFVLEYNRVNEDVLRHLLDCQLQSDENNFMLNTYCALISIQGQYSASHSELLAKLLQSLRNLKSLHVNLTTKTYMREIDIQDILTQSFDKLTKLDELTLSGPGCMYNLMTCLSQSKRVTNLKSLHIANTEVDSKSFAEVVSRQRKLEELSIIAFYEHSGGILETKPKGKTNSRDTPTGGKEIGADNLYNVYRPFMSGGIDQAVQVLPETYTRTMLNSVNIAFFKRLTLIGCEVPVKALCRFLPCLQLINLHCLESDDPVTVKPFDAKALFSEIVAVAHVSCEHGEKNTQVALPLAALELDNGAISVSAVEKFQQACKYLINLQVLSLGWKSLEKKTVSLFANGMEQLPHLSTLNLAGNHIGNSVEVLCQKLADKPLKRLRLMQVSLTEEDAYIFGQHLHYWPELKTLDLSQNQIGSGMRSINDGLRNLKKLEYLALNDSDLDDDGISGIPVLDLKELHELHVAGKHKFSPLGIKKLLRNTHGTKVMVRASTHVFSGPDGV